LTNGESDDGGFDELVEFIPNRRFSLDHSRGLQARIPGGLR
jgi:hypothetical protein